MLIDAISVSVGKREGPRRSVTLERPDSERAKTANSSRSDTPETPACCTLPENGWTLGAMPFLPRLASSTAFESLVDGLDQIERQREHDGLGVPFTRNVR